MKASISNETTGCVFAQEAGGMEDGSHLHMIHHSFVEPRREDSAEWTAL